MKRIQTPEYRQKRRDRDKRNREKRNAQDRKWRETNIVKFLFAHCKKRACKAGIEFLLTPLWIEKKLAVGVCERTGVSFVLKIGNKYDRNPWFPSIDRVNPLFGYTENNCQMVCLIYNLGKNRWTDAVMLEMAIALVGSYKDPLA